MIPLNKRIKIGLLTGCICYLIGCALCYFIWYKNGQLLHFVIILLIIGGCSVFIGTFKENSSVFKIIKYKTLIIILLVLLFMGGAGWVFSLERKRVNSILKNGPKRLVIASVVNVDLRSTRSGKQPWSIINYKANNEIIEQSFADTSKNLEIGKKYLIEYSVEYPDMFRILK